MSGSVVRTSPPLERRADRRPGRPRAGRPAPRLTNGHGSRNTSPAATRRSGRSTSAPSGGTTPDFARPAMTSTSAGDCRNADGRSASRPGAMVWHHRRPTVRGYLRQQRGYGLAGSPAGTEVAEPIKPSATWPGRAVSMAAARARARSRPPASTGAPGRRRLTNRSTSGRRAGRPRRSCRSGGSASSGSPRSVCSPAPGRRSGLAWVVAIAMVIASLAVAADRSPTIVLAPAVGRRAHVTS